MPKVEEAIKEALGHILQEELTDPRLGFATVSHVKVSKDLRHATVGVSFLSDEPEDIDAALEALEHARGFIRRELGGRVRMKYLPDLRFVYDSSTAYASHINSVLRQIERDERPLDS